ncbi:ParB/Srx family N-terminal domain-containing protein [Amycolatopsis sp. MEPSY49]|uniref:ParB/Srx family N-terminal domain-containing protein n=1 Tax=Amycolatopsis sp. MEPSY49 TaxID=3151600 RepID=UPI003EF37B9C
MDDEQHRDEFVGEQTSPLIYWVHYVLMPMGQVPRELPWHEDCMRDAAGGETPTRERSDVAGVRNCCWYHGGDWHAVIRTAVRLIAQAKATGVEHNYQLCREVHDAARADGMGGWPLQALTSLVKNPILIREEADSRFVIDGGQHRIRAMRDAGVTEILIGKPSWR